MDMEYPNQTPFNAHFQSLPPQSFLSQPPPSSNAFARPPSSQPHQQQHPQQPIHQSQAPLSSSSSPFQPEAHQRFPPQQQQQQQQPAQGQWNGAVGSGYPLASSATSMSMSMAPTSNMASNSMLPPGMMQQQ